jgi:hypothetical protein
MDLIIGYLKGSVVSSIYWIWRAKVYIKEHYED